MPNVMPTVVQLQNGAAALLVVGVVSLVLFGLFTAVDRLMDAGANRLRKAR